MQIARRMLSTLMFVSVAASAQVVTSKGMASVKYDGSLFSSGANSDVKTKAFHDAQINAIERYYAENGESQSENFDAIEAKVSENLDKFILGSTLVSESDKTDAHMYSAVVRVDINVAKLRNAIKGTSPTGSMATNSPHSPLTFLFVARQQASVKSYDDRVYKRADIKEHASEKSTRSGYSGNASVSIESGGSRTRKADQVSWSILPSGNLSTIVTGVFAQSGFQVVDAEYVEPSSGGHLRMSALAKDYQNGDDIQPSTMREAVLGLRTAHVPYLALGTLDVGMQDTDDVTGLARVYVSVTAKLVDVTSDFPRTVSAVGPVQFSGTGPDTSVARTNALKKAADSAARELMAQMNNAQVR
ncbi:hypothetical protein PAN31117_05075 [Pandoraea anapnoica]|uniref:LPP20 lipoprotein n=1 Tax=Pandoraea anapnoica TaxID=2508301 RepID=A0A5E5APZ7_9BURK|nr:MULTISPECIES: hypothetical protein [Pandoraea]VVE58576.1 hypothetical protein PIN31009_05325 [Pandoraea iniqua]VVE75077.1 hypothetical protein PAN31117_05075 [Pandoraea anapnoica]